MTGEQTLDPEKIEALEKERKPVIDDPLEFMKGYRESEYYKEEWERYLKENPKERPVDSKYSEEEWLEKIREKFFEDSEYANRAIVKYAQRAIKFRYNSDKYPTETKKAIKEYIDTVESFNKYQKRNPHNFSELESLETVRYDAHRQVGNALVAAHIVPNQRLGRSLSRIILIDRGLADWDYAYEEQDKRRNTRIINDSSH